VYAECHERGIAPVIPLRKGRIQPETPIKRGNPEWGAIYKRRTAVEREFGRLKHSYGRRTAAERSSVRDGLLPNREKYSLVWWLHSAGVHRQRRRPRACA
jgi:hypothetical protein